MPWVIDYASRSTAPTPRQIKDAGYIGVVRYLSSRDPSTPRPKDLSLAERDAFLELRIGILLVWEIAANAPLQGYLLGRDDARSANAEADFLGHPRNKPLYAAVDFDATQEQLPAIREYFRGWDDHSGRQVRPYGSPRTVDSICLNPRRQAGIDAFGWQTEAWGGRTRISTAAVMRQRIQKVHQPVFPGKSYDDNEVIGSPEHLGLWLPQCPEAHPQLEVGANGPGVFHLQTLLMARGYDLRGTAYFGPKTKEAVIKFQRWQGINPSGVVGPRTWAALHRTTDGLRVE